MCALVLENKYPVHRLSQIVHPDVSLEVALGENNDENINDAVK